MVRTFTYTPQVSPEELLRDVTDELSGFGAIHFQGNVDGGKVGGLGILAEYEVREQKDCLKVVVTIQSKPMLAPWRLVKNRLDRFFSKYKQV